VEPHYIVKEAKMKPIRKERRWERRGRAMPLVVAVLVILLASGTAMLNLGLQSQLMAARTASGIGAQCAADAGLTKAIFELTQILEISPGEIDDLVRGGTDPITPALPPSEEDLPNCDATFSYQVTGASPHSTFSGRGMDLECTGQCGLSTKTVHAVLVLQGLFDSAILAQNRISLMPNSLVSGYNSADPTDTDIDLKIGTTSTLDDRIPLGPGTVVEGDVFVGVGGDPETVIGAGGTITGEKYALLMEPYMPVITVPDYLTNFGTSLYAKGDTISLMPHDSGRYTDITLSKAGGNPGIVEIHGGNVKLHISGNIDLGQGCELVIRPGSSLSLYIDGDISADNSVGFNNEAGNVKDFALYATGNGEQVFDLKAKSTVFGVIYAPDVDITIYPGAEMCGAIVGNSVVFKSGCNFYYDEALKDASVNDEGVRLVIERWSEE
jgi:hypothetical protein